MSGAHLLNFREISESIVTLWETCNALATPNFDQCLASVTASTQAFFTSRFLSALYKVLCFNATLTQLWCYENKLAILTTIKGHFNAVGLEALQLLSLLVHLNAEFLFYIAVFVLMSLDNSQTYQVWFNHVITRNSVQKMLVIVRFKKTVTVRPSFENNIKFTHVNSSVSMVLCRFRHDFLHWERTLIACVSK
jgi:hypothetical protein